MCEKIPTANWKFSEDNINASIEEEEAKNVQGMADIITQVKKEMKGTTAWRERASAAREQLKEEILKEEKADADGKGKKKISEYNRKMDWVKDELSKWKANVHVGYSIIIYACQCAQICQVRNDNGNDIGNNGHDNNDCDTAHNDNDNNKGDANRKNNNRGDDIDNGNASRNVSLRW